MGLNRAHCYFSTLCLLLYFLSLSPFLSWSLSTINQEECDCPPSLTRQQQQNPLFLCHSRIGGLGTPRCPRLDWSRLSSTSSSCCILSMIPLLWGHMKCLSRSYRSRIKSSVHVLFFYWDKKKCKTDPISAVLLCDIWYIWPLLHGDTNYIPRASGVYLLKTLLSLTFSGTFCCVSSHSSLVKRCQLAT